MPGEAVSERIGFFGKLPAHGDFVRRGLPTALTSRLDGWLQTEFGRRMDPAASIAALAALRFASSAVINHELALGTMIASQDRVGRDYVVIAIRLSAHPSQVLPDPIPAAWDDWCGRAEVLLVAARDGAWTADATQAALETASRTAVVELTAAAPFALPDTAAPTTASWRPMLGPAASTWIDRSGVLPSGDAFDQFLAAVESD